MRKAREEYQRLKGETVGIRSTRVVEHPAATRAYTLQGPPATDSTRGIVIKDATKVVRK